MSVGRHFINPLQPLRRIGRVLSSNLGTARYYFGHTQNRFNDADLPGDTVLMIHGFFQTPRVMETLERRLRADGFRPISFNLGGLFWNFNTRGVPTLAKRIDEKIRRFQERSGVQKIHIVGHSMGGLVARYLVQVEGGADYASTVITLGTPHHGTPTAAIGAGMGLLFVSHAMWQIFPMSPLIKRLNEEPFPEGVRLVSVYSKHDLVCPWRSSVLTEKDGKKVRNILVKELGHMGLVEDPWVYGLVVRELSERPIDPASGPVALSSGLGTRPLGS
ncbi:MAG: alpha/beta fold hydrolase [Myxococcota bacterium]|nr:alpha/beta fold hydrolase [Myxococcota bacterium]